MKIQIDPHTQERAEERGACLDEIEETLHSGILAPAKSNRQAKSKIFPFQQTRLGKYYEQKRVEVIFVIENDVIITVTVYVFYGDWKD